MPATNLTKRSPGPFTACSERRRASTALELSPARVRRSAAGRTADPRSRAGVFVRHVGPTIGSARHGPGSRRGRHARSRADRAGVTEIAGGDAALPRKGPYETSAALVGLFGVWLPSSGRELPETACFELYLNSPRSARPEEFAYRDTRAAYLTSYLTTRRKPSLPATKPRAPSVTGRPLFP